MGCRNTGINTDVDVVADHALVSSPMPFQAAMQPVYPAQEMPSAPVIERLKPSVGVMPWPTPRAADIGGEGGAAATAAAAVTAAASNAVQQPRSSSGPSHGRPWAKDEEKRRPPVTPFSG